MHEPSTTPRPWVSVAISSILRTPRRRLPAILAHVILVLAIVLFGWIVLLALVLGMFHIATRTPTPQRTARTPLVSTSDAFTATARAA